MFDSIIPVGDKPVSRLPECPTVREPCVVDIEMVFGHHLEVDNGVLLSDEEPGLLI